MDKRNYEKNQLSLMISYFNGYRYSTADSKGFKFVFYNPELSDSNFTVKSVESQKIATISIQPAHSQLIGKNCFSGKEKTYANQLKLLRSRLDACRIYPDAKELYFVNGPHTIISYSSEYELSMLTSYSGKIQINWNINDDDILIYSRREIINSIFLSNYATLKDYINGLLSSNPLGFSPVLSSSGRKPKVNYIYEMENKEPLKLQKFLRDNLQEIGLW